jgi:CBS domain-containing protein
MAHTVSEVMTTPPISVAADSPVSEAARRMVEAGVGAVIVIDSEQVVGICTDRDITVRVTARDGAPDTPVRQACSSEGVVAVPADMTISEAAAVMREKAIRRLPVLDEGRVVGMVSLGDLSVNRDPDSALGGISAATPNS